MVADPVCPRFKLGCHTMKPMRACDYVEEKLVFPLMVQPKIDGVRAVHLTGSLTGRSLKPFGNKYVTARFSHPALAWLDGEMAAEHACHPDLCRLTTSALSSHNGEPYVLWHLFDYAHPDLLDKPYFHRLGKLNERVEELKVEVPHLAAHLRVIKWELCSSMESLNFLDSGMLGMGYEGTIVRALKGKYKQGTSTAREGGLLRIKRFVDFEFVVTDIIEGDSNQNEATINALGHTERSTHQANMIPNGMIGAMVGKTLNVVKDGDTVLFAPGEIVRVGAGCLTHEQRKYYFEHQKEFTDQIHKAKFFPKGIKDKPRFPTWQTFRDQVDMN
jgi:DNA ligase-1